MHNTRKIARNAAAIGLSLLPAVAVLAGPVYLPAGANMTYGDVTHGARVMSASSNPAAAAVDVTRGDGKSVSGTVLSLSAGIEYGNVQDLFDKIDKLAAAFAPSEGDGDDAPGQNPDEKPDGGIDLGEIYDSLDPDLQAVIEETAKRVAAEGALLALIATDGYAKAFVEADAPFVIGRELLGGAWTFGANWSGTSKAYSIAQDIDFDAETALTELRNAFSLEDGDPAEVFDLTGGILLRVDPTLDSVRMAIRNDSTMLVKASQTTELNLGYSRQVWPTSAGSLYLGGEAKYFLMRMSRIGVKVGDITDSDELFDAIRNSDYDDDNELGIDLGALWVADHYQLGAQLANLNEPEFLFPHIDLEGYTSQAVIGAIIDDRNYTMERQLKLEASLFTANRRWTGNVGLDANSVVDPMGDDFQWLTLSAGYASDSWWLPGARIGFRKNLAGTEIGYLGVGATVLKIVNIDIASALDTVSISGKTLPRGLMTSIGFQIAW